MYCDCNLEIQIQIQIQCEILSPLTLTLVSRRIIPVHTLGDSTAIWIDLDKNKNEKVIFNFGRIMKSILGNLCSVGFIVCFCACIEAKHEVNIAHCDKNEKVIYNFGRIIVKFVYSPLDHICDKNIPQQSHISLIH